MFIFFQKILPKHFLSRLLGLFAHCRCPVFKNWAIKRFISYFKVDLAESLITDIHQFPSFNDFFIRKLKPQARLLPSNPLAIACPADGMISELGKIDEGRLLQAKNQYYQLKDLLGGDASLAQQFHNGQFCTIYLAPKDYHRVHIPVTGKLQRMIYVPGQLFSVNAVAVNAISRVFARNERVICLFETDVGPMAVILVGAMLVGSVVTPWHGQVMPCKSRKISVETYQDAAITLQRGDEVGYFQWGSTAIILFSQDRVAWQDLQAGSSVCMGQNIGELVINPPL